MLHPFYSEKIDNHPRTNLIQFKMDKKIYTHLNIKEKLYFDVIIFVCQKMLSTYFLIIF
jgi:hypothetical protein